MATVQAQLAKLAQRIDPRTKIGQVIQDSSGATNVTGATNATPIRITSANHGLTTGWQVYVKGLVGNTGANNATWYVNVIDANTVDLYLDASFLVGAIGNGAWSAGGTITGALVGSVDGEKFTKQRLLDVYNEARQTLGGYIAQHYTFDETKKIMDGNVIPNANITFSSGSATKPTGFIKELMLLNPASTTVISIVDAIDLPAVRDYDAANTPFVTRSGNQFVAPSTTVIVDGTYHLWYYGVADFTLADVLGGTVTETFNVEWQPRVLQLAEAIGLEQGTLDPLQVAATLFGGKK